MEVQYKSMRAQERGLPSTQRMMPLVLATRHLWTTNDGSIGRELSKGTIPYMSHEPTSSQRLVSRRDEEPTSLRSRHQNNDKSQSGTTLSQIRHTRGQSSLRSVQRASTAKTPDANRNSAANLKGFTVTFDQINSKRKSVSQVLADFNIDEDRLNGEESIESKRRMVVQAVMAKVQADLKALETEMLAREHRDREEDRMERLKNKNWDIFEWLDLPTKNVNLKRLLRSKLVQLFTEVRADD
jgi:hypothetical protein